MLLLNGAVIDIFENVPEADGKGARPVAVLDRGQGAAAGGG